MSLVNEKFTQVVQGVLSHDKYNPKARGEVEHLADQINRNHQYTPEEALLMALKDHFGHACINPNTEIQIRNSVKNLLKE